MRRRDKLRQIPPDWDLWQKLYYKHTQAYLRQRLLAIKYLWQGKSRPEVTQLLGCNYKSLTKWIDNFLEGGLQKLTQPITHQVPSRLQPEQQLELKKMLLEQKTTDYGIDRYRWTVKIISQVIHSRWGVTLRETRIYEIILAELGIKEEIEVEFIYTPPYSPNFNLVEYLIHQLRLQLLHHQSAGMTIELIRDNLEQYLQINQLQTPQQIQNTIAHICSLATSA
jgi:transposase